MVTINPCDFSNPVPCGVNPSFTYTRYPCDQDDPRPNDTRGLPVIVNLQTPVKAEVVNRYRESILAIEGELGIQPSGTYGTVRDRLDAIENLLCLIFVNGIGGSSGDGYQPIQERLSVSDNQTLFTLSFTPYKNLVLLFIDGIKQEIGNYIVNATQLTWIGPVSLISSDVVEVFYFNALSGGGKGHVSTMQQDVFTATSGQTIFPLSKTPINEESLEFFVNGVSQTILIDYILSGGSVIYSNTPPLLNGDVVVAKYLWQ